MVEEDGRLHQLTWGEGGYKVPSLPAPSAGILKVLSSKAFSGNLFVEIRSWRIVGGVTLQNGGLLW
jgi:hypothetical protein